MTSNLTLHVHDDRSNAPAAGLRFQLYWVEAAGDVLLRAGSTNARGTTAGALLDGPKMSAGIYRLVLHAGDYFDNNGGVERRFLDHLPITFVIDDASCETGLMVRLSPRGYAVERSA
ncbi:MAG TPA: hydroxyisourate hydrolase [Tepidisphaeraceae bacterium]